MCEGLWAARPSFGSSHGRYAPGPAPSRIFTRTRLKGTGQALEPQRLAGRPLGRTPADKRERLRNRVDLIVADPGKSKQLGHEFVQPWRVLGEMHHPGMEVGGLRGKPHDLIALELAVVLMSVDPLVFQRLDQTRPPSPYPR